LCPSRAWGLDNNFIPQQKIFLPKSGLTGIG
jgi:hypothetical protein